MSRHPRRRLRIISVLAAVAALGFVAAGAGPAGAAPAAGPAQSPAPATAHTPATAHAPATGSTPHPARAVPRSPAIPHTRPGVAKAESSFGPVTTVAAGDEIITASADTNGYHLFAASSGGGWRWQPLTTLEPGGDDGQRWIGEQCLTGDGRYVVAVVAPWSMQNSAAGMAAGGTAYVVDAHTGATRPLATGVTLAYFDPGCGVAGTAALTRFTADESHTQVLLANLSSGAVQALPMTAGELTSAVPAAGWALAARGRQLVTVSPAGVRTVAALPGQTYSLRPNAAGGADLLAEAGSSGRDPAADAFSWSPARSSGHPAVLQRLGQGKLHELRLYGGAAGRNILLGAASTSGQAGSPGSPVTLIAASGIASTGLSLHGQAMLRNAATLVVPAHGSPVAGASASLPRGARPVTSLPAGAASRAAASPAKAGKSYGTSRAGTASPADGTDPSPTCAVPRLSDSYQVPQPTSAQIEWASQLAGSGRLYGPENLRPAGFDNLAGPGWDPSSDFPLPTPFGPQGSFVPKEILDGVMAQESNWNQASPHAPQGVPGDPYVADYYGYNSAGTIDYSQADCGYGLGQLTDIMRLAAGQTSPTSVQQRVAVDYAENVAAAAQTLASKWNFLTANGITIDRADPAQIEDWYFAVWAYNSGVNPQASTGNTTGCTPGAGCTDSAGNWGLGWANNPANPIYDVARHPFLHLCEPSADPGTQTCAEDSADAAHPAGWPYQEKVFGWIETPLTEADGLTPKYPGTYDYSTQTGFFLSQPAHGQMCDSSDHCDYTQPQPCSYSSASSPLFDHCWWHHPVTGVCTASSPCHQGHTASAVSAEPASSDPFPGTCTNTLPSGTVLIDDGSADGVTTGQNLAGCPQTSQSNGGSFSWHPNFDTNLQPIGLVDLHQLGTGYGGHMLFTHLEDPAYNQWGGTAEWDLTASYDVYDVAVFVPGLGAAGTLSYTIYDGRGNQVGQPISVDQNNYTDQWVNLGRFYLGPGAKVTTTNVVTGGDGTTDVAFDAVAFSPVASYAAIGDSYSSGVGTGNYDADSNVSGGDQCLRSPDSYPRQFGAANGYPGVLTVHLACSGAVIKNLTTTGQYGEPAQISAIPRHASLVTVTIGGNDAGFEDVLKHCLIPGDGCEADYTTKNTDPDEGLVNEDYTITNLEPRLEAVYNAIKTQAPGAKIVALTYPGIFQPTSSGSCLFQTGLGLSAQDIEWLISETNNLDNQIVTAGRNTGITVLDERYAFAGHEVCTASPTNDQYVNGATSGIPEAFHPNAEGYRQETADLAQAMAKPSLFVQPLDAQGRGPRPGTPNPTVAHELLSLLKQNNMGTYDPTGWSVSDRAWFQRTSSTQWLSWPVFGNCDTQRLVLRRDAVPGTWAPSGTDPCTQAAATWWDPYQGRFFSFPSTSTKDTPTADHVIPLKDAWSLGAADPSQQAKGQWTQGMRVDFANDQRGLELLTISNSANGQKSDNAVDTWAPPNTDYHCTYAEMWVAIKYQWNLKIDASEYDALQELFLDC
jgi:lysophospholipase L1-like esterase